MQWDEWGGKRIRYTVGTCGKNGGDPVGMEISLSARDPMFRAVEMRLPQ